MSYASGVTSLGTHSLDDLFSGEFPRRTEKAVIASVSPLARGAVLAVTEA